MNIKKLILRKCTSVLTSTLLVSTCAQAFVPNNFWTPYDPNWRLARCDDRYHFGLDIEFGKGHAARNWRGDKSNVLRTHNHAENVVAMLLGYNGSGSQQTNDLINALISALNGNMPELVSNPTHSDNAIAFKGKFSLLDMTLSGQYTIPQQLFGGHIRGVLYVPIRDAHIKHVEFININNNNQTLTDELTGSKELFQKTINNITPLDFGAWKKTGIGDLVGMLTWDRCFKQEKGGIKSVDLGFNLGMTAPTADERDINKAFSMSLGNDGAWGIPFGLGLGLNSKYKITIGTDAQFLALFNHTGTFRLKTDVNQTENILLQTGRATKSYGLTWQFNLYLKSINFYKGLSVKAGYEYTKHDSDKLTPKSNDFNSSVINSAHSLLEWNNHSIIGMINWDSFLMDETSHGKPQLSIFCKIPVGGRNVVNPYTFGGQLAVNF